MHKNTAAAKVSVKTLKIHICMLDMVPAIFKLFDNIFKLIHRIKFCTHCIKVKFWSSKSLLCCVRPL